MKVPAALGVAVLYASILLFVAVDGLQRRRAASPPAPEGGTHGD